MPWLVMKDPVDLAPAWVPGSGHTVPPLLLRTCQVPSGLWASTAGSVCWVPFTASSAWGTRVAVETAENSLLCAQLWPIL